MTEPTVSGDSARWLIEQLGERNVPAQILLDGTGLQPSHLAEHGALIAESQYARIVANALADSGDPALGLTLSRQTNYLSRYGFWGYAIMSCANFAEAVQVALAFWDLSGSLIRPSFRHDERTCRWDLRPAFSFVRDAIHVFAVEKFLSSLDASIRAFLDRAPPLTGIGLSYPAPAHAALYREYFDCPIVFEAPDDYIEMDTAILDWPLVTGEPKLAAMCREQCRELLARMRDRDDFVKRVQHLIAESPGRFPRLDDAAARLGLSGRTFRRMLKERDTSYQHILDTVRTELAEEYLRTTTLGIDQIAALLGFAETTTFRAAFKKWTGRSAAEVRRTSSGSRASTLVNDPASMPP